MILYRILLCLAAPPLAILFALRVLRGLESPRDVGERLGLGNPGLPAGAIWVHGASVGELTSARPLVEALAEAHPGRGILVTANTVSGRALAETWEMAGLTARLAPLDFRWAVGRFMRRQRPAALVALENELWPNRLLLAGRLGIPAAAAGARMSERSAMRWRRMPKLAKAILGNIGYLSAQDGGSAERFAALGVPPERIGPVLSLKALARLEPPPEKELARLRRVFRRSETWLAASTHPGEEAQVLEAFRITLKSRPELKLIIAPRHPARGARIASEARRAGWRLSRRAAGEAPDADTDVYLADTLGEMSLWYALAGVTFVGGSLVKKGGHTPYEPADAGTAILHGPHVENFAEVYERLDAAGGALVVADSAELARVLGGMIQARRWEMAKRASVVLVEDRKVGIDALIDGLGAMIGQGH